MKKYRLLKDLPTFKAGGEFIICCGNLIEVKPDGTLGVCAYSASTLKKFPNILTDWFEEIKESNRWKPEYRQNYYCVASDGSVAVDDWSDWRLDDGRFEIGNCFQTREEAEQVIEYLKALAVVRGDATTEFLKGKDNYYVVYNAAYNCLDISDNRCLIKNGIFGLPYFATEEDALRSIELHKKEWLTIFGIEDKK